MSTAPKWGVVATIKAPAEQTLAFAAWHLEQGAHRVFVYFDEENPAAFAALKAHSKCRPRVTHDKYWAKRGGRPDKHQSRQTVNASDAYTRARDLDWLAHVDVDEFLRPTGLAIADQLARLPEDTAVARARPIEALSRGDGHPAETIAFKAMHRDTRLRQAASEAVFPTWGRYLGGGFLSHLAGKIFVRTGLGDVRIRIHNAYADHQILGPEAELDQTELCHLHAKDWEDWLSTFRFRLERGSYRAELNPSARSTGDGVNLHTLFSFLLEEEGEAGLRRFFDEVCLANSELCEKLDAEGLLRIYDLELDRLRSVHFPGFSG